MRKLGIEPGEGRLFCWAAAVLALCGWADVSVKIASETLFNKRGPGVALLPLAFLLNSFLLVGTTYVLGRVAARSNRPKLVPRVMFGVALLTAYGLGHCLVIAVAGAGSAWVQRTLDWNAQSRAGGLIKKACGVLVILGGLYLLHIAH